jgi:perosamine synthetase
MKTVDNPIVPWSARGSRYSEEDIAFVAEAMRSADTLTQGKYQDEFEAAFTGYIGAQHSFAVSSCTAALFLAATLSKVGPGDDVIIPSHTFAATAIPFGHTGAKILWADIDPETLVVSAETIQAILTPNTKVIVVVHLYGLMADMDPIMALAKENNVLVIEDAAQALGASDNGRKAGSIGDIGCFSFHTHKNISTLGEGGMLTLNDDTYAEVVPGFRHNGMRSFTEPRDKYWLPAMSTVDFDWDGVWPYNFCLGEIQCAAGLTQLKKLDELNAHRRQRAESFMEAVKDYPEMSLQKTPSGFENVYYCLPAFYDPTGSNRTRDDFVERMAFHHKVQMVVQYFPLDRLPIFKTAGFEVANCPEADNFFDNMVSFPFHEWMPEDQFQYLIDATIETLEFLRN